MSLTMCLWICVSLQPPFSSGMEWNERFLSKRVIIKLLWGKHGYTLEHAHEVGIDGIVGISLLTKVYKALLFYPLEETIQTNVTNS